MATEYIRIKPVGSNWFTLGTGNYSDNFPENIQATANTYGADQLTFTLKRNPTVIADFGGLSEVVYNVNGIDVWEGYIWETPTQDGPEGQAVNITARGWQYHLDDDLYSKMYVHADLSEYRDGRSYPESNLATQWTANGTVTSGDGAITVMYPKNQGIQNAEWLGVILDLGPGQGVARSVVTVKWIGANGSALGLYCRSHGGPADYSTYSDAFSVAHPGASTATYSGTYGTVGNRYVSIFLYYVGATAAAVGEDLGFQITSAQHFNLAAYESGNASVLKASDVIKNVLPQAPLLSQSTAKIATTSFSIPHFNIADPQTPRSIITAANAYHAYRTRIVPGKQLEFSALPTVPKLSTANSAGSTFSDASANAVEPMFNKAVVTGTGPDGTQLSVTRTSSQANLLTRAGRTRAASLPITAPITTASATALGDAFLSTKSRTPFKGEWKVSPGKALTGFVDGAPRHPSTLLLQTTELVQFRHLIDPDSGAVGRSGIIDTVTYSGNDVESADVAIDNTRSNFEALLSRLAAVTTAPTGV